MCWSNYITPSNDTPSKSGLYANGLPGVTLNLLDELTKDKKKMVAKLGACSDFADEVSQIQ